MLLERLRKHTTLSADQLEAYARTASRRYASFEIAKRSSVEMRPIHQPSREIKALQRWLVAALIRQLPVHEAASAYKKGACIRDNAKRHCKTSFTVRLDFENFFPSFRGGHVEAYLQAVAPELNDADLSFVRRIVCRHEELTIGAPSSPALTNAMMHDFDEELAGWCKERGLIYTRYADDMFISAFEPNKLKDVPARVAELAAWFPYATLRINRNKTAQLSRKYRRTVTGLVLTPDGNVSIGRGVKRKLRSDIFRYCQAPDECDPVERSRIAGKIAFARDVEPKFFDRLVAKYGAATIERIVKGPYIRDPSEAQIGG